MAKAVERVLTTALHKERVRRELRSNARARRRAAQTLLAEREKMHLLIAEAARHRLGPREIGKCADVSRIRVQESLRGEQTMPRLYEGEVSGE